MKHAALPDLTVGLAVTALGVLTAWLTWVIPVTPVYAVVGPKLVPAVVAAALVVLGLLLCGSALRGGWSAKLPEVQDAGPPNLVSIGWLCLGMVLNLVLIVPLGFAIGAAVQFVCTARAFGSRAPLRDAIIALIVSLGAFFLFVEALGVNIGAGVLEGAILRALGQEVP
ncbi:tripartite tricarboxylate transporter TctB family protein [Roseomonas terrae]|jgi:putative tricarboxylic transport membrane protein|uniref:Tripartite tricarboxylate transporter TctB family protein n=1 Tax=Neoroseomonas terrae TaxID=424799 RepID=A0ABS5ENG8_9PROT|nr:tripartite tricarboxylate transporter TctB family protein [Neoroseomonas terrae]MBR0652570.1 tripartite tricarboxylate transporter TctB family protein [Neoroseomonas terrae]